jgi:uncharacterized membrane protein YphA (DoxX/SURF4 family)
VALSQPAEGARQRQDRPDQPARQAVQAPLAAVPAPPAASATPLAADAEQTREALRNLLNRYPPSIKQVFALDPLLLQNAGYLQPYPEIAAFLQQHPDVARNASFYLEGMAPEYFQRATPEDRVLSMWGSVFGGMAVLIGFFVATGALVWLIKTLIDYRRWYRLSKVQTEAHNKLLDRFTANEELQAYMATPSGRRFLESAPITLDAVSASVGVPVKRILWAVEIGLVLACGAGGLMFARRYVPTEIAQALSVIGTVFIALGIGFVVAALASYLLSRQLGVLGPAASRGGRDTDGEPVS